ncbi:Y-family DNA polymerase [Prochlorococcus marinus]|uniref:Y-family DNA polymerase n=1 Tax=Prochlorococcus marinus TaxID=1219 RepID=UPI0022B4E34E|nr:Y-family DNA polymerase [Prochlorococcus marinus]
MAIALIDSNNFYAACEQSIDPSTHGRPLVVLSNNDSCIIARNAAARQLGISMGQAYFKIRHKLKTLDVEIRSSNYALYGDMSQRLMNLIKANCEEVEVYSIDEAFVKVQRPSNHDLKFWAQQLRELIYQNLSLPIAIGIGSTKSQAKLANYIAKTMSDYAGIFDLEVAVNQDDWLEKIAIENVWGVGKKLAYWCRSQGVNNVKQFRDMPKNLLKTKFGITGIRLQHELKGKTCLELSTKPIAKKEICVSRSFSHPITNIKDLRQAIAIHTIRASQKLRSQKLQANTITIFTRTSHYTSTFYSQSASQHLNIASNDTQLLLSASLNLTKQIFHSNRLLMKAGVIMQNLLSEDSLQLNLFSKYSAEHKLRQECLMKVIDRLNKRYGQNTINWAICGANKDWEMCRKHLSASATTRFKEIPIVIA